MRDVIVAFLADESGDDVIEYVLLATLIGTAGAAALQALPGIMTAVYQTWDAGARSLWETPNPQ